MKTLHNCHKMTLPYLGLKLPEPTAINFSI